MFVMKKNDTAVSLPKLLVIDDEEEIGILIKRMLRARFSSITVAHNLAQGLELCKNNRPDIILLDNDLPDGRGVEQLSQFKAVLPQSCFIIISAMSHLRSRALEQGAFAFIDKPLSFSNIIEVIDSACNGQ